MPWLRLAGRRNRDGERDWFPLVVKVAAVVVVGGVVAGFLLVSGGGGHDEAAVTNPPVPTITGSGGAEETESTPPPPPTTVAAPAVGTHTAVIAPKPRPKPTARPQPTSRPPLRDPRFARPGQRCSEAGEFAFTRRFEPLVCRNGRWQRIF